MLFALLLSTCMAGSAAAQLQITRFTVDGGGGSQSTGGAFSLGGTIGQPDAGSLVGPNWSLLGGFWAGGIAVTGVEDGEALPTSHIFRLHAAAPNPFRERTRIAFDLPRAMVARVALYDAAGRVVRGRITSAGGVTLGSGFTATRLATGLHVITFSPAFAGTPALTLSPSVASTGGPYCDHTNGVTSGTGGVRITTASGTNIDDTFDFIAIGPR